MNHFNFRKRALFSGPHFLGTLLIFVGLLSLVSPAFLKSESSMERTLVIGLGAIIIGLLILSSYSGTLIDFEKKKFKEYSSICGFKFGEWTSLPTILSVRVVSKSYISTNTPSGISPTLSGKVTDFKILVYSNDSELLFSFDYSKKQKAIKHAKRLSHNLKVDLILDTSE